MPRTNTSLKKILDAAGREFSARGYHLTSMDDIAKSAEVAKGTLYYNFPTKAALFKDVVADGMEYMMTSVNAVMAQSGPALEMVKKIIRLHIEIFSEHPHIVRIMFNEISGGLDEEIQVYLADLRERYESFFAGLLELGVQEGVVKPINGSLLASVLIDLMYSTTSYLVDHPEEMDGDSIHSFLDELLFCGVFQRGEA